MAAKSPRSLLSAFATVSGFTGLSRILGFVRDMLMGAIIGPGLILDAWFAAFTLPNIFRRTFAEGAMQAAFVPLLRGKLEAQGEAAAKAFARQAFTALLMVLIPLSVLLILFMPWIIDRTTQFEPGTDRFELAVIFGRIMFPYLMLMTAMAYIGSILNTLNRFGPLALAPTMLNVILVGLLALLTTTDWAPGYALSWGVLAAGFAQIAVVWWPARKLGWAPNLAWPRETGAFFAKMFNGIIANGGMQISSLIVLNLATTVEGDFSNFQFANRLYQLPLGLIGIALNTVLIASLSKLIERDERPAARNQLNRALEVSLLLSIPVALTCAFHAEFLFRGLFEVGNFSSVASAGAALALVGYAAGIPAAIGQKVLQPAFFARQDTRTPMYHSLFSVGVAVAFSYLLYPYYGLLGLTIAASISAWTGFISLAIHTNRLKFFQPDRHLVQRLLPMLASGFLMTAALGLALSLTNHMAGWSFWVRLPTTIGFILCAIAVYFFFAFVLRATSRADLRKLLGRA